MDTAIDILATLMSWGIVGYLVCRGRQPTESLVQHMTLRDNWRLSLCLALYFTLSVAPITRMIDMLFPWHQTSRLLAYISVGWGAWFLYRIATRFTGAQPPVWAKYLPSGVTFLLILLFPFSLALSPRPEYDLSLTLPDLLLRDLLYLYVFALLAISAFSCWRLLRIETATLIRLRLALSLVSLSTASGLAIVKIISASLRFYAPETPLLEGLIMTASLLQMFIVLPWLLIHFPARMTVPALQAWHSIRILRLLGHVRVVEKQVRRFCTPIAPDSPTLWDVVRRSDYYATRSLIHILDGRKLLVANPDPEAVLLLQKLNAIEGDLDFSELLLFYANLGRQMRKKNQRADSPSQQAWA